jgi:hypothetical protein
MPKLKKEVQDYSNQVTELLEAWNMEFFTVEFHTESTAAVILNHVITSFVYDESTSRCALGIMAVIMEAYKQIEELKKKDKEKLNIYLPISKRTH